MFKRGDIVKYKDKPYLIVDTLNLFTNTCDYFIYPYSKANALLSNEEIFIKQNMAKIDIVKGEELTTYTNLDVDTVGFERYCNEDTSSKEPSTKQNI